MSNLNVTTTEEMLKLTIDDICGYVSTRPSAEIMEFKEFCSTDLPDTGQKPSFFKIRSWFMKKYFPDVISGKKQKTSSMLDKIMAL